MDRSDNIAIIATVLCALADREASEEDTPHPVDTYLDEATTLYDRIAAIQKTEEKRDDTLTTAYLKGHSCGLWGVTNTKLPTGFADLSVQEFDVATKRWFDGYASGWDELCTKAEKYYNAPLKRFYRQLRGEEAEFVADRNIPAPIASLCKEIQRD